MFSLSKKIEEFTDELFADLGLTAEAEEKKADLFARIEDQFHRAILDTLRPRMSRGELAAVELALTQESYNDLENLLKKYPQFFEVLENKIQTKLDQLKLTIAQEQKDANAKSGKPEGNGQMGSAAVQP